MLLNVEQLYPTRKIKNYIYILVLEVRVEKLSGKEYTLTSPLYPALIIKVFVESQATPTTSPS